MNYFFNSNYPSLVTSTTTTTTVASAYGQSSPSPTTRSTTTTTPTTTSQAAATTRFNYVTQPVCGCQPSYTGDRCEVPVVPVAATTVATAVSWNNLCKIYADRNMNICQNGGQCVFISDGKVACVCPSMYVGQYCETPVYTRCLGTLNNQCHRDYVGFVFRAGCLTLELLNFEPTRTELDQYGKFF